MQADSFFPDNYRRYLTENYEARSLRNPSYSLRAYARDLDIAVSTLTEVLKGKYGLSKARVSSLAKSLSLSAEQSQHFADLVRQEHARDPQERAAAKARIQARLHRTTQTMTLDGFKIISDWYHLAILELITLKGFKNDPVWMAKRLGLPELTVKEALERLLRLELIEESKGHLRATDDFSHIGNDTPSQAIRKFHKQILEKALAAIESQSVQERENSSTIFAIAKKDLPEAKKKLSQFRREFAALYSEGKSKDEVYCLSLQFFNLLTSKES
jgi:uncharacterized protein (TIGR02147 family)